MVCATSNGPQNDMGNYSVGPCSRFRCSCFSVEAREAFLDTTSNLPWTGLPWFGLQPIQQTMKCSKGSRSSRARFPACRVPPAARLYSPLSSSGCSTSPSSVGAAENKEFSVSVCSRVWGLWLEEALRVYRDYYKDIRRRPPC